MFDLAPDYNCTSSWDKIIFQTTDPSNLSDNDLWEIFQIEQDMWSRNEWLWEYLKCDWCSQVYSKQDIYGHLNKQDYQLTVSELEEKQTKDIFCCKEGGSKLLHSFWKKEYIKEIRERYTSKAILLLMQKGDKIIGFMDWYVGNFETIYEREFHDHYWDIGINRVREMVKSSLDGVMPDEFFSCSSSWTRERYMNMIHIFNLLQKFYENFPKGMETVTALSELHSGWPYARIFWPLWAKSIGIRDEYETEIDTTSVYDSDIFVHKRYWESCKKAFSGKSRKEFLNSLS
jgi:hypothetical protein